MRVRYVTALCATSSLTSPTEQDGIKKPGRNQKRRADGQRKEQGVDRITALPRCARSAHPACPDTARKNTRRPVQSAAMNADVRLLMRVHKRGRRKPPLRQPWQSSPWRPCRRSWRAAAQHQRNHEPPERGGGEHRPLNGRGIFHTVWVSRLLQRFRAYFFRTRHKLTEHRRFSRFTGALAAS